MGKEQRSRELSAGSAQGFSIAGSQGDSRQRLPRLLPIAAERVVTGLLAWLLGN